MYITSAYGKALTHMGWKDHVDNMGEHAEETWPKLAGNLICRATKKMKIEETLERSYP
jgi:hypothetical protein